MNSLLIIQGLLFQNIYENIVSVPLGIFKCWTTTPSPKLMERLTFTIKASIFFFLSQQANSSLWLLENGVIELPIKEETDRGQREWGQTHNTATAQHNRPFFQLVPQHSTQLSPSHYSPAAPPAPSPSLPFQYKGDEWGRRAENA